MSNAMHRSSPKSPKRLAGTAVAALLIGWAAGAGAQTIDAEVPPPQQASLPASSPMAASPSLPLGYDDVREVQNQLISLGFDPGIASSPFVATFVDVTGIIIYFSIAKMYLL